MILPPQWTVFYNIASPESSKWVGTGWEFFDELYDAEGCARRLTALGNTVSLRPYHPQDESHLGAAHRMARSTGEGIEVSQ